MSSENTESVSQERRRHMRFKDPQRHVVQLEIPEIEGTLTYPALLVNESYSGIAAVVVGNLSLKPGTKIIWHENSQVATQLELRRIRSLEEKVFLLGMEFPHRRDVN